jgi:hypothetical protein
MKKMKMISFMLALAYVALGTFTLIAIRDNESRVLFFELLTFPILVIGISILYEVPREIYPEVLSVLQPLVFMVCWFFFYKLLNWFASKRQLRQTMSKNYIQPPQMKKINIISFMLALVYVSLGTYALLCIHDNESRVLFFELLTLPIFVIGVSILHDVPQEIYPEVLFILQPLVFMVCWFFFYKLLNWFASKRQLR